jgi:uncharacterized membrane protein
MGTMRLPLLILHILAGSIGLLTGTVAMAVRKGGNLHRAFGNVFTIAMLTLAISAFCLAILKSQQGNIAGSVGAFYLIGTAWLAGRRGERTHLIDGTALFIGLAGAVAAIAFGRLHPPQSRRRRQNYCPAGMSFSSALSYCSPQQGTSECSHAAEFQTGSGSLGSCGACATDSSLRQALSSWVSSKFSRPSCAAHPGDLSSRQTLLPECRPLRPRRL